MSNTDTRGNALPLPCAYLLKLLNEVKLYHWTTLVYARHKSSDKLYKSLQPAVDAFVETYIAAASTGGLLPSNSSDDGNSSSSSSSYVNTGAGVMGPRTVGTLATNSDRIPLFHIDTPTDSTYVGLLREAISILSSRGAVTKSIGKNIALASIRDDIVEHLHGALYSARLE